MPAWGSQRPQALEFPRRISEYTSRGSPGKRRHYRGSPTFSNAHRRGNRALPRRLRALLRSGGERRRAAPIPTQSRMRGCETLIGSDIVVFPHHRPAEGTPQRNLRAMASGRDLFRPGAISSTSPPRSHWRIQRRRTAASRASPSPTSPAGARISTSATRKPCCRGPDMCRCDRRQPRPGPGTTCRRGFHSPHAGVPSSLRRHSPGWWQTAPRPPSDRCGRAPPNRLNACGQCIIGADGHQRSPRRTPLAMQLLGREITTTGITEA